MYNQEVCSCLVFCRRFWMNLHFHKLNNPLQVFHLHMVSDIIQMIVQPSKKPDKTHFSCNLPDFFEIQIRSSLNIFCLFFFSFSILLIIIILILYLILARLLIAQRFYHWHNSIRSVQTDVSKFPAGKTILSKHISNCYIVPALPMLIPICFMAFCLLTS